MKNLFERVNLGPIVAKNRFIRSATAESMVADGDISLLEDLYKTLSKNNIGTLITGAFEVCPIHNTGGINNLNDKYLTSQLDNLSKACHQQDTKILMQIQFMGPGEDIKKIFSGVVLKAITEHNLDPNKMSIKQIQDVIERFAEGALIAYQSGFDGIQIHGAHGYLINRFLSPYFNQRKDEYGKNTINRTRIATKIAKRIRKKTGKNFVIAIKINCHDLLEGGIQEDEFLSICNELNGYYDAIEVSTGTYESIKNFLNYFQPNPSMYRDYARSAKNIFNGSVMLVGNNIDYDVCNEVINNNEADFISISKGLICEPDLITRWKEGDTSPSKCINCKLCLLNAIEKSLKCYKDIKTMGQQTKKDLIKTFNIEEAIQMNPKERDQLLIKEIKKAHEYHYENNSAYQAALKIKGIKNSIEVKDIPKILRPTSAAFKTYISYIGTAIPQYKPQEFMKWLFMQLSFEPPESLINKKFSKKYNSLDKLLSHIEKVFKDYGFEITTSSGTSGKSSIMVRDKDCMDKAMKGFWYWVNFLWEMRMDYKLIFIMPVESRIQMAKIARIGTSYFEYDKKGLVEFMIPFKADPDMVRIRSGRNFKSGFKGFIEKKVLYPFVNFMYNGYVRKKYVNETIKQLENASKNREDCLLFGGLVQIHHVCLELLEKGYGGNKKLVLTENSFIGSGGGMKELYEYTPRQIKEDLRRTFILENGKPIPIRDAYGMAEANWAAFQCDHGNYHIPPWVFVLALDNDDNWIRESQTKGRLAFLDPLGHGSIYPPFFVSADRVELINPNLYHDPGMICKCGLDTPYLISESIVRQDFIGEAGCAAQI